ncbi:MAG: phosphatidylglycerophosphatase A [Salinisphaeraceae bacterium]|nr:phosphatidylglycerophosphatase A [Salinisphaeraceae bacterium]
MNALDKPARPDPKVIMKDPVHFLAFGFGSGLSPVMPGTAGTVIAIPLFLAMQWLSWPVYVGVTVFLFVLGVYLCGASANKLATHDHPGIVWDEIVGYLVTMLPLLPDLLGERVSAPLWFWVVAGFIAFRFFDIIKPPPIKQLDQKVHGGLGIMIDDVLAGVFAAVILALLTLPGLLFPAAG